MGCNCKNKTETKRIEAETQQLKAEIKKNVRVVPSVTLEEILVIENMIGDINTNQEKRGVIIEFVERNFGEIMMNYCDQVCQRNLRNNLQSLKNSL